ncbi:MAG: pyridoxamine 5'-phosphate oxidase family protein [Pseudomonadota bacterium]
MTTPFDPERVLSQPLMAYLATIGPNGPRNAPVWFHWEDGTLSILGSSDSSSIRRIEADPRCAVEIVDYDNAAGRLLHLGLRGTATITAMDTALFKRLLRRYLGADEADWNPWFIDNVARIEDPEGRLIRLKPDSIFTNNVSFFRSGPDLAT